MKTPEQRAHELELARRLRTGEFKQYTGGFYRDVLSSQPSFCILGAARFVQDGNGLADTGPDHVFYGWSTYYEFDFEDRNGIRPSMVELNDCAGVTFPQFADLIEAGLVRESGLL